MGPLLLHNSASFHGDVWEHVKICRMRRNLPCRNLMQATEFTLKVNRPRCRSIRHCHFAGLRRALHTRNCMRAVSAAFAIPQFQFERSGMPRSVFWRNRPNPMREQPTFDAATSVRKTNACFQLLVQDLIVIKRKSIASSCRRWQISRENRNIIPAPLRWRGIPRWLARSRSLFRYTAKFFKFNYKGLQPPVRKSRERAVLNRGF
jgi:hypothetical protein